MKKIMLFAAACAALAACSKDIDTTSPEIGDGSAFVKGQKVTLTVKTGDQTKVTSSLDATTGAVDFKWETGDKIKVTVGTESAEFTLSSGAGEATAEFTGSMPAAGNNFDVQYPVSEPDLTTQTYVANALPKDKMKMAATNCTIANNFTLTPQYAALRLNLYGGAREVSQIVVTGSSSATYTLSLSSAVTVGKDKDNATPFFVVLPASESFVSAEVTANAITPTTDNTKSYESYGLGYPISASTTFAPTEAQFLTAGSILNMPAVSLTTVWAPVNCGYDATNYPMGLLYQWGRKYGQAYETGTITPTAMSKSDDTEENKGKFGKYNTTDYNWFSGGVDNNLWNGGTKGAKDPCPEGWRVPTMSELDRLMGGDGTGSASLDGSGWDSTNKGYWFNGTESPEVGAGFFLPAAGCRSYIGGSADYRGNFGLYWSSSVDDDGAWGLYFLTGGAGMDDGSRAGGYSVRCVQE